jgi:hypothetical protein
MFSPRTHSGRALRAWILACVCGNGPEWDCNTASEVGMRAIKAVGLWPSWGLSRTLY